MQHRKPSFQWLAVYKTFIVVIKTKTCQEQPDLGCGCFINKFLWDDHLPKRTTFEWSLVVLLYRYDCTFYYRHWWSRYYFLQYTTLTCDLTRFLNVYTGVCCAWFGNLFWLKTLKQNLFLYFFVHWDSFHLRLNRHCKGFQGVARKRKALLKSIY